MLEDFMKVALEEAKKAYKQGEVPVGAVIVKNGKVISKAHNETRQKKNAVAHAEILAIDKACKKLENERLEAKLGSKWLSGCELYVTLEPCAMCAGAIVQARIPEVMIGTRDLKSGAANTILNVLENEKLNHRAELRFGIFEEECREILKTFFKELRDERK